MIRSIAKWIGLGFEGLAVLLFFTGQMGLAILALLVMVFFMAIATVRFKKFELNP